MDIRARLTEQRLEPIVDHPHISPKNIIQRPKVVYSGGAAKYHVGTEPTIWKGPF